MILRVLEKTCPYCKDKFIVVSNGGRERDVIEIRRDYIKHVFEEHITATTYKGYKWILSELPKF